MIKSSSLFLYLILILIGTGQTACKAKKTLAVEGQEDSESGIYENFAAHLMDFYSYEATATIITSGDPGNHRFKCTLRGIKDSIIWGSLQKFGFEFARIKITPTRFQMVNRIERTYIDEHIEEVSKLIGINLEFQQFWNLLKGLPLNPPLNGYQSIELDQHHDLNFGPKLSRNQLMITKSDGRLEYSVLKQEINPNITALVQQNYKDYKTVTNNKYFSYIRLLEVKVPTLFEGSFQINFDQINPNAKFSTGFEIPQGYSRSDI